MELLNNEGQRFAGLEERVVLSSLFRHFTFRSTQTIEDLQLYSGMVLRTQLPVRILIESRQ